MIYEVIIDLATNDLDRTFDYLGDEDIEVGSRVLIEFGKKQVLGFIVGKKKSSEFADKLKSIIKVLDVPITKELFGLLHFLRNKYHLRYIDVLRLFVPSTMRSEKDASLQRTYLHILNQEEDFEKIVNSFPKNATKQIAGMKFLIENQYVLQSKFAEKFGQSVVNSLEKKNLLEKVNVKEFRTPYVGEKIEDKKHTLNSDQTKAVEKILNFEQSKCKTFVLHGVTGSGKTEVYQTVIDKVLENGKTAIMLVPEISLTPQIFRLFRARFGEKIAILHSGLSNGERFDEWTRIFDGEAQIVVGARSAIFAPMQNLGAIIIDEEHDSSYQSTTNPRYDTKVVAEYRAKVNNCPLILGSATPDIETFLKAKNDDYELISMPNRISKHKPSDIEIVDMGQEFRNGNNGIFSVAMIEALKNTIAESQQAMIFLNRRGYSSFLMCKECGYTPKCESCDVSLTYHKSVDRLKCHFCGKNYTVPKRCPKCGSENIRFGRTGTEKVVSELKKFFPQTKILRMDNDTTSSKGSHIKILESFGKGEADILVGTQMIAKGHDFANVTFVGILDVDFALFLDDYRSSERVFQLVTQVAGRAGRAEKKGRVILQTFVPNHYVFKFAKNNNYLGFYEKECNAREVTQFPPFTKIVRILVSSEDDKLAFDETKKIFDEIKKIKMKSPDFVFLNAMRSPVNKIKDKTRYQVLMRLLPEKADEIIEKIYEIVDTVKNGKVSCFVEINPQSLH